ncbi:ThiF family adenylyltransferase [Salinigranum halophilum]|uniref:ThiF family adenylyltransferase n=1 Tax=Salinigranum halophilum TaxID=2565931 RepID=UPI00137592E4|nr:ThiF family adenylyltransferase [Salinigranum halophilum]
MASETPSWNSDRTETALSSLVDGGPVEGVAAVTDRCVTVSVAEPTNENCQHALFTSINLLARLHPVVGEVAVTLLHDADREAHVPGVDAGTVSEAVAELEALIDSPVTVTRSAEPDGADATLHLGAGAGDAAVSVGSDGWLVQVATDGTPTPFSGQVNSVGSYGAACMGVAEVFKTVLRESVSAENIRGRITPVGSVTFSTYDYSVDPVNAANPELPGVVNLHNLNVVGVGAGGGALVQTLSALDAVRGTIRLVDSDEVSASNLNRYIWAYRRDVGSMKAEVGKRVVVDAHPALTFAVQAHPEPYIQFSDRVDSDALELVVSAVDTVRARKQIQWDFPETVLDAATNEQGDYVVLRVAFGEGQCLACKHQGRSNGVEREMSVLSEQIGLDAETLVDMNTDNAAFTREQVDRVAEHVDGNSDITVPEPGERFSDWFRLHCGHIDLGGADMEVPVPFLPVTAGVLVAGEVIKQRHFPEAVVDNRFTHNMLGVPVEGMHRFTNPHPDCEVCGDPDAVARYEEKWETSGKPAVINFINEAYPANRSAEGQADVVAYLYGEDAFPGTDPELRTRKILECVPTATRNHIDNLVNEVGLVEQHEPQGGSSFIFHERTEERLYDVDLGPIVDEEIERLLAHVADDAEVRQFVAALLDIDTEDLEPEEVVEAIRDRFFAVEDEEERMDLFDEVAQEIEAADVEKDDYDYAPIGWRRSSNRYTLTQRAVDLYEGER